MYCEFCGKQIDEGTAFCPYCGQSQENQSNLSHNNADSASQGKIMPDLRHDAVGNALWEQSIPVQNPMMQEQNIQQQNTVDRRKLKARYVVIPMLLLFLFVGTMCAVLYFRVFSRTNGTAAAEDSTETSEQTDSDITAIINYETVNEEIITLSSSDEYTDLDTEEKAELILSTLETLAESGEVAPDSVGYDETNKLIYYAYADGACGGVMLEEFASDSFGGSAEDSYIIEYDENGFPIEVIDEITIDTEDYPYLEENLSALIMVGAGDAWVESTRTLQQEKWTNACLQTDMIAETTVEEYRDALGEYDFIVLREHGLIYCDNPTIALPETVSLTFYQTTDTESSITEEDRLYIEDLTAKRIGMYLSASDGQYHYFLFPAFFEYYYGDNRLENSIVWISSCSGYMNDSLVKSFAACGAKAVLGCTETVKGGYEMCMSDAFVYMLLYGNTVEDSLVFAKEIWGENDSIFWSRYHPNEDPDTDPSEFRYYNGGGETLVTLTDDAKASLSVSVEEITFERLYDENAYEYAVITAYNENGKVLWEYSTLRYEQADLYRVDEIGWKEDCYYFVENGSVIALDSATGEKRWENVDFGGGGTGYAFGDNAIYLCGYYGPDFYAISYEGETLYRIEQFYEEYYWAMEIELEDNLAIVYMHGGVYDWNDPAAVYVDLLTGSYSMMTENAETEWKDVYTAYISELEESKSDTTAAEYEYALVYVDDNDVPELFIVGLSETEGERFCTIGTDGSVVECWLNRTGGSSYIEYSGMICNFNGNMDYYPLDFYRLEDGVFTKLDNAQGLEIVEWDDEFNGTKVFSWNGEEVTEEEFYENWNSIMDLEELCSSSEATYHAAEILAIIAEMY